jgi:hypothetical protein
MGKFQIGYQCSFTCDLCEGSENQNAGKNAKSKGYADEVSDENEDSIGNPIICHPYYAETKYLNSFWPCPDML